MSRRTALALLLTCAGALFIGLHAHAAGGSVVPHVMTAAEAATTILDDGRVALTARFRPDRTYVEESALPAVRAPGQSAYCLARLAVIAATAA